MVDDLCVIAFYYLLYIGEYTTKTRRKKKTRTRQFRRMDVTFFILNDHGDVVALPQTASDAKIMNAVAATLRISNQKNGDAGACVHHSAIPGKDVLCPVRALGRRVMHIRQHSKNGRALLCTYWDEVGQGDVTDSHIRYAVKFSAKMLKYEDRGIPINRINTHSLRSGGACAMALSGHSN